MERRDDDILLVALLLSAAAFRGDDPEFPFFLYRRLRDRLRRSELWDPELDELFSELTHTADLDDPALWERIHHRLRRRLRGRKSWDPELDELVFKLIRAPRRRSRRRTEEVRETAASVMEGFRRSFEEATGERVSSLERELGSLQQGLQSFRGELQERVSGLSHEVESSASITRGRFGELESRLDSLNERQESQDEAACAEAERGRETAAELHALVWMTSTGADLASARITRHVPVRLFVGDPVPSRELLERLFRVVEDVSSALGFEKAEDLPEESGSLFKTWWARLRGYFTQEDLDELAETAKRAAIDTFGKKTAQRDKTEAEASELRARCRRQDAEAGKLDAEAGKLKAEAGKLKAEAGKLKAEARKLKAEARKLKAEAEADLVLVQAMRQLIECAGCIKQALVIQHGPLIVTKPAGNGSEHRIQFHRADRDQLRRIEERGAKALLPEFLNVDAGAATEAEYDARTGDAVDEVSPSADDDV